MNNKMKSPLMFITKHHEGRYCFAVHSNNKTFSIGWSCSGRYEGIAISKRPSKEKFKEYIDGWEEVIFASWVD